MSNYRKVRKETAERMGEDPGDMLPCIRCHTPTDRDTLSLLGARCQACYDAYCRLPMAEFNARFKRDEPQRALPRMEQVVAHGQIGEFLAKRPTADQVRGYADELGVDIPPEFQS